jgi:xanthine dehydrogenase accessory factor
MDENEYLAKTVDEQLHRGRPLVLISLMSLKGSTPRHGGTKMVVGEDGQAFGTIGGSLMESAAVQQAKLVLMEKKPRIMAYELSGKDAAAPGMICGGQAEIMLDYLATSAANRAFSLAWREAVNKGKGFYMLTHFKRKRALVDVLGRAIFSPDGGTFAGQSLTAPDIEKLKPEFQNVSDTAILPLGDTHVMVDRIRKVKTLYCFGAGHVAVPTARLAALVGFRVVVVDDRPEYASAGRFPEASQLCVVADLNKAFEGLEIDPDSYIVIVTRGHQFDRAVLGQSLKTGARYIGMISSRRKKEAIYEYLLAQGVSRERLEQVHSPIGIDIGAETPEEIAVSIVAELIKVRSVPDP